MSHQMAPHCLVSFTFVARNNFQETLFEIMYKIQTSVAFAAKAAQEPL